LSTSKSMKSAISTRMKNSIGEPMLLSVVPYCEKGKNLSAVN